jgi:hypothetical protein
MFFLGRLATSGLNMNTLQGDILGLLNGSITAVTGLSANFVQATSRMNTTVAAGWTTFDAAAGTAANGVTPKVMSSAWSDDPTKFKYLRFSSDASTTTVSVRGYETWNSSTHAGTNPHDSAAPAVNNWGTLAITADRHMIISSSANHFFIMTTTDNSTFASLQYYFTSEYTRDDEWNTVANGYPAWFSVGCASSTPTTGILNNNMGFSRLPNMTVTPVVDLTTVFSATAAFPGTTRARILPMPTQYSPTDALGAGLEALSSYISNTFSMDTSKNQSLNLMPIRLSAWNTSAQGASNIGNHQFGSITAKSPFIYPFKTIWAGGDEVDIAGIRYLYVTFGGTAFLIKEQ